MSPDEAKDWVAAHRDELCEIVIEPANGGKPRPSFAFAGFPDGLGDIPDPPARVRVLSPFDPLLRDRNRAERLFDFFYRIEVFVPEPKREYGYYVFPLLEGDRMIGRIDMKADRKRGSLDVRRLWLERASNPLRAGWKNSWPNSTASPALPASRRSNCSRAGTLPFPDRFFVLCFFLACGPALPKWSQ